MNDIENLFPPSLGYWVKVEVDGEERYMVLSEKQYKELMTLAEKEKTS